MIVSEKIINIKKNSQSKEEGNKVFFLHFNAFLGLIKSLTSSLLLGFIVVQFKMIFWIPKHFKRLSQNEQDHDLIKI